MAAVTLSDDFFDDPRFDYLAALLGLDPDLVRMKIARIWAWQTDRHTAAAPAYVVPLAAVIGRLGPAAPDALVQAELAERRDGGLYMSGSEGRIEWLDVIRARSSAGGKARAARAGRVGGRFASAPAPAGDVLADRDPRPEGPPARDQPATSQRPARHQPETSPPPARDQHQDQYQDQISELSPPPRDPTVPTTVHQPVTAAPELVQHALTRIRAARRELDPTARELPAFGGQSETELLQRLRRYPAEERRAVLDQVLNAAIALARERGTVDRLYLGGIATEPAWAMLEAKASPHRPRAGPKRSPHQRHTAADELTEMFESGAFQPTPSPKDTP